MFYSKFSTATRAYPPVAVFLETLLIFCVTVIALTAAIVILNAEIVTLSERAHYSPVNISVLAQ